MEQEKASHRAALIATLRSTAAEDRAAWSAVIRGDLLKSELWRNSRQLMLFAASKYEPDLLPLLDVREGRQLFFPALQQDRIVPVIVQSADELQLSPGGIREPSPQQFEELPPCEFDLVLVPGLGFSPDGTRLGRGRGHFDRFLAGVSAKTVLCGVCFSCQLQPALPSGPHDVCMDCILTENGFSPLAHHRGRAMDADP